MPNEVIDSTQLEPGVGTLMPETTRRRLGIFAAGYVCRLLYSNAHSAYPSHVLPQACSLLARPAPAAAHLSRPHLAPVHFLFSQTGGNINTLNYLEVDGVSTIFEPHSRFF